MTIEIHKPELEALIVQRMKSGGFQNVEDALVAYANEQMHYRALADAVSADRRAVELSNELYKKGLGDFLAVLTAERSLYQDEDQLAQSQATVTANLVALYKALGGGWENTPAK